MKIFVRRVIESLSNYHIGNYKKDILDVIDIIENVWYNCKKQKLKISELKILINYAKYMKELQCFSKKYRIKIKVEVKE